MSVGEAVDDHDARVMGIGETGRVDDAIRSWWKADLVCSATPSVVELDLPRGWERWLLFDDPSFALDLGGFACTSGGELTGLHELANVSIRY